MFALFSPQSQIQGDFLMCKGKFPWRISKPNRWIRCFWVTKWFSFKRTGPMQNPPPTHCLAVSTLQTPQDQEFCVSHSLNVFSVRWRLFGAFFPGPQEEGRSGAPCPSSLFLVPAVSKGAVTTPGTFMFLDLGQALLPPSSWSWGRELRGLEPFPFPSLSLMFGSKEHWTISDIMAQSQQGFLSSLTPQIKHPCPWDRQEGVYARSRIALFPFLLNSVISTSKLHPWWFLTPGYVLRS